MKIIFSRHGNTFAVGDPIVWIGAREDVPLVSSGRQQAKDLARVIRQAGCSFKAVYCGPLRRTYDYADIVLKELGSSLTVIVDARLNEIDYGDWSGFTKQQIQKKGGGIELSDWENLSRWPRSAGWRGSPQLIFLEIKTFVEDLIKKHDSTDTLLVVTSNGRLRYFLQLLPGVFEQYIQEKRFKVGTGNLCLFTYVSGIWEVKCWDKEPNWVLENNLI